MGDDRQMTWDELCAEMVKQRKRAEKAEAGEAKTIKVLEACEQIALDLQARIKEFEKGLKAIQKADCICCYGADLATSLLVGKE